MKKDEVKNWPATKLLTEFEERLMARGSCMATGAPYDFVTREAELSILRTEIHDRMRGARARRDSE